jgi:hypothetical protein
VRGVVRAQKSSIRYIGTDQAFINPITVQGIHSDSPSPTPDAFANVDPIIKRNGK